MNMKYECWAYVNNKPDKMTYVSAPNREVAHAMAIEKFEKLGVRYDWIKVR